MSVRAARNLSYTRHRRYDDFRSDGQLEDIPQNTVEISTNLPHTVKTVAGLGDNDRVINSGDKIGIAHD